MNKVSHEGTKTTKGPAAYPKGLRFDGSNEMLGRVLLNFTEIDKSSPSYGGSFVVVDTGDFYATSFAIVTKRAEVRERFAAAVSREGTKSTKTEEEAPVVRCKCGVWFYWQIKCPCCGKPQPKEAA